MTDKIRWGILSTANINKALLGPIQTSSRSELAAVASRDLVRAQAYANEHRIPTAYGSYEEMLAAPDIDAVYISLPNRLHAEWAIKAAEAGKNVLCEKPLVTTVEDFASVEAAASANGVTLFEAFMYLHHPQMRTALAMIQAGELGTVQQISSWFHFYLDPKNSQNVRLIADLHGGSIWDVGVYPNSMAIVMAGGQAPQRVWASQIIGESAVDVATRAQLDFGGGAVAQISSGFRTPFREGTHVVGDQGMLHFAEPWKPGLSGSDSTLLFTARDGSSREVVTPAIDPYLCEVQAMEACILDGADPVVPLSLSRAFLQSALAINESAASGQIVNV